MKIRTPNIILRYIAKKYFITVFLTSVVLSGVLMLADSVELARKLASKELADGIMLQMLFLKSPNMYLEILPFSFLIGTLICFSSFAKTSELVAVRSSGVSAWQFLFPAAIISLIMGAVAVALINPLASSLQKKYESIERSIFPTKAQGVIVNGKELWLRYSLDGVNFALHAQSVSNKGEVLEDVSVFFHDDLNRFVKRYDSKQAVLTSVNGKSFWNLKEATLLKQNERFITEYNVNIPTQMTPEKIKYSFSSPKTISVWELPKFIKSLESAGFTTLEHKVRYLSILFLPILCMAMFVLGAPFALHFSRKGGLGKLLMSGLGFGFVFYMFNNIILTLAQADRLNLYIAVIIPIIIALLIGVYMLLHFREE